MSVEYLKEIETISTLGKEIGLEGRDLKEFLVEERKKLKEQRDADRDARTAEREHEKERQAHEKERQAHEKEIKIHELEIEKERQTHELNMEEQRALREKERRAEEQINEEHRLGREKELLETRTEREKELLETRADLEQKKNDTQYHHEIEMANLTLKSNELQNQTAINGSHTSANSNKYRPLKLPKYDETKDDMDAYINRFERYAVTSQWEQEIWALNLSTLLTGQGLQVYDALTPNDADNYIILKRALLRRYKHTEVGFREKFKNSKPDPNESAEQYTTRITRYLHRWIELADVGNSIGALVDLLVRDQFLHSCPRNMATHILEQEPKEANKVAIIADHYINAHGGWFDKVKVKENKFQSQPKTSGQNTGQFKNTGQPQRTNQSQGQSNRPSNTTTNSGKFNTGIREPITCFLCGKKGHRAKDCIRKGTLALVLDSVAQLYPTDGNRPTDVNTQDNLESNCNLQQQSDEQNTETVVSVQSAPYYGKFIADLGQYQHGVRGKVYVTSDTQLYIREFYYDGNGPDAFVWMGATARSSSDGVIIPVNGSSNILDGHTDATLRLDLPMGTTLSDYKWVSIWCRRFRANFGDVIFAADLAAPAEMSLGSLGFTPRVHNVFAEDIIIENERQIRIINLDYDGGGPDAYYWAGTGPTPTRASGFALIEDVSGSADPIPRVAFNDKTVRVTFPEGKNIFDVDHFGLWCDLAQQDFGHVDFNPAELNIPVYEGDDTMVTMATSPPLATTMPLMGNCEVLIPDQYHVMWTITGNTIEIALSGRIATGNYLAFGLSGSPTRTTMIGSDVVVAWLDAETGSQASVVDYSLSQYGQCIVGTGVGAGTGACPDELSSTSSSNDVTLVDYSNKDGIITISYTKQLDTGDATGVITIPTDQAVYVAWAVGPINPAGLAAKHRQSPREDFMINFGRASSTCLTFSKGDQDVLDPWENVVIAEKTEFVADMGQAGGQQGYEGITGSPGWGIAWYINQEIIPILTLKRGTTYTFQINGGNNPALPAAYHPFYITNDPEGGYAQKSTAEQQGIEIYAGPDEGSLCEWRSVGLYNPDSYATYAAYRDQALERQCDGNTPGMLTWTPDENTPDRVYYQCYTHKFLGWKINVVDGGVNPTSPPQTTAAGCVAQAHIVILTLMAILSIVTVTIY